MKKNRYLHITAIIVIFIILIFIAVFLNFSQHVYAEPNQMLIKKDKVIVFEGYDRNGGWIFSTDGKSKKQSHEIGVNARVVTYFNKYAVLSKWKGYQTDTIELFDTDKIKHIWTIHGACLQYIINNGCLYMKIEDVKKIYYAKVTSDGNVTTSDSLDVKIKFLHLGFENNSQDTDGISVSETHVVTGMGPKLVITDSKYNKKYNTFGLDCLINDSNYIYTIQCTSAYEAPPLGYFIRINRRSGVKTKIPIFISFARSLQFYNNKLMFWGQDYSCKKDVDTACPTVFIIDKDGKNIKPLYAGDGTPSDTFNIFSDESRKSYKAGDKIYVPKYSKVKSNSNYVTINLSDKIYAKEGMLFQKGTNFIAFLNMNNSTSRIISFKKGSNTGILIKDGLPYNVFASLIHKKYILFEDENGHTLLLNIDSKQLTQVSPHSVRFLDEDKFLPSQYAVFDEYIYPNNDNSISNIYLYDLEKKKKLLIAKDCSLEGVLNRNNLFYYIQNHFSMPNDNYSLCTVNLANGLNYPPNYLVFSAGLCGNFIVQDKYLILYSEIDNGTEFNLVNLTNNKCILNISGHVDCTLSKDNKLYYLTFNNNILEVNEFDINKNKRKNIFSSTLGLNDYRVRGNGQSISIESTNSIKIKLFGKHENDYLLNLTTHTLKEIK